MHVQSFCFAHNANCTLMLLLSSSWLFQLSIKLFNGHLCFFRKLQARQAFAMYLQRVQQRLVHETRYAQDRLCFMINLSKLRHYRIGQSLFFKTRVSTNLSSENNLIFTQKILHIEGSHTQPCLKARVKKLRKL